MREETQEFLVGLGMSAKIKGFGYIGEIIDMLEEDKNCKFGGDRGAYAKAGALFNSRHDWRTIERLCRYAKKSTNVYKNMTLKEWLMWATLKKNQTTSVVAIKNKI